MKRATAEAPANIAFVKYWGKKTPELNIPLNGSISMNLSAARTTTSVEFESNLSADQVFFDDCHGELHSARAERVVQQLDRLRSLASTSLCARVVTKNTFPRGVGIASSASGMAALTVAGVAALGLDLTEKDLSILARLGSGSACRSIPSGFVEWLDGADHASSYAFQLASPEHWDIVDLVVIVSKQSKAISSSEGHALAQASPFFQARLHTISKRLDDVRTALLARDFDGLGHEIEMEAISLHTVAMSSPSWVGQTWISGLYYWAPATLELMVAAQNWRLNGMQVYFTLDAGPTVHLICPAKEQGQVLNAVKALESSQPGRVWQILVNTPARGAHVTSCG